MKLPLPKALRKPAKPSAENGSSNGDFDLLGQAKEVGGDVVGWVDERTGGSSFLTGMLYRKVPKGTNWYYSLGSATLFAFVVQALTGVFLAMFYTPSTTQAYASVAHLTNDVFLGQFVRGMHRWGASLMVILVFVHMGRTFFFGAYKYPRELNWIIGVVLLILTLLMGFTGYLLPFDQRSFWATVVGVNINGTGPVVGPYLSDFLRAGPELGATTLSRFYAIHMLLVPGALMALIGAHLYLVVKLGTTAPPWIKAERPKSVRSHEVGVAMAPTDGAGNGATAAASEESDSPAPETTDAAEAEPGESS